MLHNRPHLVTFALLLAASGAVGALTAVVPATPSAFAQAAAPSKEELDVKARALKAALSEKRYGALAADIPPKLLTLIAGKAGVPVPEFVKLIQSQIQSVFANASIEAFELQDGEIKTLANGSRYALLPNVVRMTVQDKKAVSTGHVLAIVDDGTWYLARVSEQQWPLFVEAYPAYAAVEIPKEKMEFLK